MTQIIAKHNLKLTINSTICMNNSNYIIYFIEIEFKYKKIPQIMTLLCTHYL